MNTFLASSDFLFSNFILKAAAKSEFDNLKKHLEAVELSCGKVIYESGEPIKYVYFPESCIITLQTNFADGNSIESGIVGSEGAAGACAVLFKSVSTREAVVRVPGLAFRMRVENFRKLLATSLNFKRLIQRYVFTFIEQTAQIGACNSCHSVESRLARLLLMYADRSSDKLIWLTQESVAQMLGTQRPSVSVKARELKDKGVIDYIRVGIRITDRAKLKTYACECYGIIKATHDSYLKSLNTAVTDALCVNAYDNRRVPVKAINVNRAEIMKVF